MTIIATNALLDLVTDDPRWFDWLAAQLGAAAALGPRVINDVIYAEVRFFSPARCFSAIERPEALGPASCPISSSALTPRSWVCGYSAAVRSAIGPISRRSISSLPSRSPCRGIVTLDLPKAPFHPAGTCASYT
jgi:hypothetical protein